MSIRPTRRWCAFPILLLPSSRSFPIVHCPLIPNTIVRFHDRIAHELRFCVTCWWLSQHVEFLEWRLRLEALMPPRNPIPCRRRPHKEFSTLRTRCNGMCANDQCYDRIDEQGPLRLGVWRWAARWCMSLLRAWLPTHQPAQPADLHRPSPASRERDRSLCSKTTRCRAVTGRWRTTGTSIRCRPMCRWRNRWMGRCG